MDTREDTIAGIGSYYGVPKGKLNRHYKKYSSGYREWQQKTHAVPVLAFKALFETTQTCNVPDSVTDSI